jgi:tRNA pseudouridine55 synthase
MKTNLIRIRSLKIRSFDPPVLTLQIHCSKGTYIRALARDLGQTLGSGAHLTSLQRSGSGNYRVKDAISIEDFDAFFN